MEITQQTFVLMKTSWRRLEDVLRLRLQKTSWSKPIYSSWPYVCKTSSRRFQDVFQDVFKTSSRRLAITSSRRLANTFWRHLQDVLKTYHQRKLFLLTSLWVVFNMFVRRTTKTVVYRRIHLGHISEKFKVSVQNLQDWKKFLKF